MLFQSTRGQSPLLNFSDTVMAGLAPDGGLFVPQTLPSLADKLPSLQNLSFQELCVEIVALFSGDEIPRADLERLVKASYLRFDKPEIIPVVEVGGFYIAEQFHGPTLAFKDLALQFLGNLFEYLLQKRGGRLTILGATSGDTGSAAIHAMRGKKNIEVFILHPLGRVSPIQELQMTTVVDPNVHNLALRSSFDEAQAIVKALFNQAEFRDRVHLGAVNSINWVRVMVQMVYFFYTYFQVIKMRPGMKLGDPIRFSVPTGNFGHILAGRLATQMGLPVEKLVLATNANDNLHRFLSQGVYAKLKTHHTLSPSMDIQVASNFERYLYELAGRDPALLKSWLDNFERQGELRLDGPRLELMRQTFASGSVEDETILETIRQVHSQHGYLLDPHTAVGVRAAMDNPPANGATPTICMATAHPAKFGEAIQRAVGQEPPMPESVRQLASLPSRKHELEGTLEAVKGFMEQTLAQRAG